MASFIRGIPADQNFKPKSNLKGGGRGRPPRAVNRLLRQSLLVTDVELGRHARSLCSRLSSADV